MGTRPPAKSQIAVAVLFALSVFGFTLFVWKSFGGTVPLEAKGYEVRMSFGRDASSLVTNADVRIAGVNVGKVKKVQPVGTRIEATVALEPRYVPLPRDARAIVRAKTLLGETFIELSPGTKGTPTVPDGGLLAVRNIQAAQGLDEVLGSFDADTRKALKGFLGDMSVALDDRGADISAVLGNAAPATADLRRTLAVLDAERPALRALLRDTSAALEAVSSRQGDLQELVRAGDDLLGATAQRNARITETVRELPGFLRESRTALDEIRATAVDAAPTLRTLRPVAPLLEPALDEATRLAPALRTTFRRLDPVISVSRAGLPALTQVVDAARPLLRTLVPAGQDLVPVLQTLEAYRDDAVDQAAATAAATNASTVLPDGSRRRYLRVLPPIWTEGLMGFAKREPYSRANAYPAPGTGGKLATGGLEAFDCRNTTNPAVASPLGAAPPCITAKPWTFAGRTRSYPNAERATP